MKRIIVLILIVMGLNIICRGVNIPRCNEDSVLVGVGQFNNGRWTAYECGPAVDNFSP